MAKLNVDWTWPVVSSAATLGALTLGVMLDGVADWCAAALLLVPTAILAWKMRWASRRR